MRALVLSALVSSVFPVALLACDQDYASSTAARETFMGDSKEVPSQVPSDASAPKAPPMAPPQMGPLPPPIPQTGDASTDAAVGAARAPAAPHPVVPAH